MKFKCRKIFYLRFMECKKIIFFFICSLLFQNEKESISNTYKHSYTNYKMGKLQLLEKFKCVIFIFFTEICQLKKNSFKRTFSRTQTIFNQNAFRLERRASDKKHLIPKRTIICSSVLFVLAFVYFHVPGCIHLVLWIFNMFILLLFFSLII